jgi:hypothetical protein
MDSSFGTHPDMICVPARRGDTCQRDDGLPYFLFIAQEKCGSTAFGNVVPNGFGLPCVTYCMSINAVVPSWAQACAGKSGSYITHLRPREQCINALSAAGLRGVVHTRDPRQTFLSYLHHYEIYRHDYPDKERAGYYRMSFDEKVRAELPVYDNLLRWITGWWAARERLNILFTCFEDFVERRAETTEKLLAFYGGDRSRFNEAAALTSEVDTHLRLGEIDEWRGVFDRRLADEMTAKIPAEIFKHFRWTE